MVKKVMILIQQEQFNNKEFHCIRGKFHTTVNAIRLWNTDSFAIDPTCKIG